MKIRNKVEQVQYLLASKIEFYLVGTLQILDLIHSSYKQFIFLAKTYLLYDSTSI